jgi:hypothetical protein
LSIWKQDWPSFDEQFLGSDISDCQLVKQEVDGVVLVEAVPFEHCCIVD